MVRDGKMYDRGQNSCVRVYQLRFKQALPKKCHSLKVEDRVENLFSLHGPISLGSTFLLNCLSF